MPDMPGIHGHATHHYCLTARFPRNPHPATTRLTHPPSTARREEIRSRGQHRRQFPQTLHPSPPRGLFGAEAARPCWRHGRTPRKRLAGLSPRLGLSPISGRRRQREARSKSKSKKQDFPIHPTHPTLPRKKRAVYYSTVRYLISLIHPSPLPSSFVFGCTLEGRLGRGCGVLLASRGDNFVETRSLNGGWIQWPRRGGSGIQ